MKGEDLDNSFTKEREYDDLKVILFSEFPLSYPGGGERLIKLLDNSLRNAGINVGIIENTNMIKTVSILEENLNITSIKFERFGFMKFLYQDFPPLSTIPIDNNVVSLVLLRRVPPRSILKQLRNTNSKVIFCLHGIALEKIRIANPIIVAHQLLIRIQLRDLARYCGNHIFIQSLLPSLTSYLIAKGADSKNVFTIENQLMTEVPYPERNDEDFNVTFIGRIEDLQKGIKRLKKVIFFVKKSDKNIKFNIIGTGDDIGILKKLGTNVNILKRIDDQKKNKIIASSNLGIVTSNLEPYSLVVLEFLTSGVPVVSTPASGPAYILSKDNSFGRVVSFNAKSLAKSIVSYHREWENDKELYFSKRKDLFNMARKTFNSNNMLESYMKMILQVRKVK